MEEDLHLYRMRVRIVTKCWFDMKRFPKIKDIIAATGLAGTTLLILSKQLDLPKRTKENIKNYLNH
jgi:hypothetical protein